jgi:hypothetical protein
MEDETMVSQHRQLGVQGSYEQYTISNVSQSQVNEISNVYAAHAAHAAPYLIYELEKYGPAPHPAFHNEIVDLLLRMAESDTPEERLAAVYHALTPHARVIMMQGDENKDIRTAAKMRTVWEDQQDG